MKHHTSVLTGVAAVLGPPRLRLLMSRMAPVRPSRSRLLATAALGLLVALALPTLARGGWKSGGFMNTAREEATATLLPDGRVLVAGGLIDQFKPSAAVEVYDPV